MHPIPILLISFAMSTDAFAAAVGKGAGMRAPSWMHALRVGALFGVIEGLTPLLGWLLGSAAAPYIEAWDHWIAFLVLGLLGAHMIHAGFKDGEAAEAPKAHGFWNLAATGFATSIDAMAVGVGLALLDAPIAVVALAIGLTTFVMVTLGIKLGHRLGSAIGKRAEVVGGLILIVIGSVILQQHLSA